MANLIKAVRENVGLFARAVLQRKNKTIIATMPQIGRPRMIDVFEIQETNDFVRLSTLELCCSEILQKNVAGALAELGVYRGTFAAKMNALLPDRSFYLFDTFEGFDARQEKHDRLHHQLNHTRDFSDTSIGLVLEKMRTPNMCVVRKGLFPETAVGITEEFCLVSLDADLFEPLYAGLQWFWPRLAKGGFILVHDHNNAKFPGARAAVIKFSHEFGIPFVPVTDPFGTAIFAK